MTGRVLVTGSQGFTGRYLVEELERSGFEVFGLGVQAQGGQNQVSVDLLDKPALDSAVQEIRPAYVVHLAAIAHVAHGDVDAIYKTNLLGSRNLLSALAALETRPHKVLLASSANVYGNQQGGLLNEQTPPAPANDYAVSKLAMEYMARTFLPELPIVLARPFNYTGVGQSEAFVLPKIVSHFASRKPVIELGNMDVSRDFSDVRAVVSAYSQLLTSAPAGDTINIASGQSTSLQQVVDMCADITGHQIEVRVNPAFMRRNEVRDLCGDASRLRALVPAWRPVPLEETLRWMVEA